MAREVIEWHGVGVSSALPTDHVSQFETPGISTVELCVRREVGSHSGVATPAAWILAHEQSKLRAKALSRCVLASQDSVRKRGWHSMQAMDNRTILQSMQRH